MYNELPGLLKYQPSKIDVPKDSIKDTDGFDWSKRTFNS